MVVCKRLRARRTRRIRASATAAVRRSPRRRRLGARSARSSRSSSRTSLGFYVARGAPRPGGRPRAPRSLLAAPAAELERFGGTVKSSSATPSWRSSGHRSRMRTTRSGPSAPPLRSGLGRDTDEDLQVRIAVNTGEALVLLGARPSEGDGMAAGDVVNHGRAPPVGGAGERRPSR